RVTQSFGRGVSGLEQIEAQGGGRQSGQPRSTQLPKQAPCCLRGNPTGLKRWPVRDGLLTGPIGSNFRAIWPPETGGASYSRANSMCSFLVDRAYILSPGILHFCVQVSPLQTFITSYMPGKRDTASEIGFAATLVLPNQAFTSFENATARSRFIFGGLRR